jgi:hypothetical protein
MQHDRVTLFLIFLIGITATTIGVRNLIGVVRMVNPTAIEHRHG